MIEIVETLVAMFGGAMLGAMFFWMMFQGSNVFWVGAICGALFGLMIKYL